MLTPEYIESLIEQVDYFHPPKSPHVTICCLTLKNGFCVTGLAAPIDPDDFVLTKGKDVARENAVSEVWRLEGYRLRQKMFDEDEAIIRS